MAAAEHDEVDEEDVALIDALHVHPRATFTELGAALDVSAVTVGRRWRRLSSTGRAWVSSAPGPALRVAGAVLEVACVPGRAQQVAAALAARPQVFSVHRTSGAVDLYALVVARDHAALTRLLVDDGLACTGTARCLRSAVIVEMFSGAHWRLGAISAGAADSLARSEPVPARAGGGLGEFDRALFLALQRDGRASYRALSRQLGRTEQVVRRRIEQLERTSLLTFRTDFVRPEGGWPAQVALSLRVPDERVREVGRDLGAWPETRVCVAVVAAANLFVTVALHDVHAVEGLLARLRTTWPDVEVVDRRIVLRPVKSWGRVLDAAGRCVDTVPVDLWA